jgi:hypothetical protein
LSIDELLQTKEQQGVQKMLKIHVGDCEINEAA